MRKKWYGYVLVALATISVTLLAGPHLRSSPFETEDSASNEPKSRVFLSAAKGASSTASIRSPQSALNFTTEHESRILQETNSATSRPKSHPTKDESKATNPPTSREKSLLTKDESKATNPPTSRTKSLLTKDESKETNTVTSRPKSIPTKDESKETNPGTSRAKSLLTKGKSRATNSATSLLRRSPTTSTTKNASLQHTITKHSGSIKAPQNCKQKNCLENLSERDKRALKSCENKTRKGYKGSINESDCKFLPNNSRRAVALISAPGAGNTWTRGLLEKASGICTGYLFCDLAMRAHGYVGENIKTGRVLVVKTHSIVPRWGGERNFYFLSSEATYSAAVFILRNPVKSAVAEWNRYSSMMFGKENSSIAKHVHTYTLPKESFGELFVSC